jgi:hypothetical protein
MKTFKSWAAAAAIVALSGAAHAAPVFQGRLADGSASATCTSNGANGTTKCAMFYNTALNVTILNDWNIGRGFWSATAAAGSAQALVETAGAAQTNFTGWFLPTGNGFQAVGALNQYLSIWNDVGGTLEGLLTQFDGVQSAFYWSGTEFPTASGAWLFSPVSGIQGASLQGDQLFAVAVRPGDVTASVPEPQTLALVLLALGATAVARRRRSL